MIWLELLGIVVCVLALAFVWAIITAAPGQIGHNPPAGPPPPYPKAGLTRRSE